MEGNFACPFCRAPYGDLVASLEKRVAVGDSVGMYNLGVEYSKGRCIEPDMKKAIELFHRAAEHGSVQAHAFLSSRYSKGGDGFTKNLDKAKYHLVKAAMGGHNISRGNIAAFDFESRQVERGMKHHIIAASDGYKHSLHVLRVGYANGLVQKEDFAGALRAYQETMDSVTSKERDEGMEFLQKMKVMLASSQRKAGDKK